MHKNLAPYLTAQAAPAPVGFVNLGFVPVAQFATFDHFQQGYISVKPPTSIPSPGRPTSCSGSSTS